MQHLKRTPFLLALSTLALASALLLSCTGLERAVSYDRYKIDPKSGAAIERFMKQILGSRIFFIATENACFSTGPNHE